MDRPITVTGGAGFIGSHLVRRLAGLGRQVSVLDDLSAPAALPMAPDPAVRLVVGDVRDRAAVTRGCDAAGLVLHLASVVGVDAVTADPERTGSVIRDGTAAVLEHCRRTGARLVAFSTSEVTDTPRQGPRAVYAEAKRDAEALLLDAAREVAVTIIRPFNIVGPGQSAPGMVLPALARAARRGEALPVHGDGRQERSFLHVDDLVDAVLAVLVHDAPSGGEVLEIGSEERVTIGELAEALANLAGTAARPAPATADRLREDRPRRGPDLSALRRRTAFAPRVSLAAILTEALVHA
jgi:UDP-glucose 4-epimerase